MKKAHYHQEAPNKALLLTVIKENTDGTVDLGHGDEKAHTLVVGSCPLSEVAKPGHAVLVTGKAKDDAKDAPNPKSPEADTAGSGDDKPKEKDKPAEKKAAKAGK